MRGSCKALLENPFASLLVPPGLFLAQFLLLLLLFQVGFPHHARGHKLAGSLLLIMFFGTSFLSLAGAGLGLRQTLTLKAKAAPLLGVAANLIYLAGFILFFLFVVVVRQQA